MADQFQNVTTDLERTLEALPYEDLVSDEVKEQVVVLTSTKDLYESLHVNFLGTKVEVLFAL